MRPIVDEVRDLERLGVRSRKRFKRGSIGACEVLLTSLPAQPRDDGTCPGELLFIIRRTWRIADIAYGFRRHIDLAERGLSHAGVPPPLGKEHQRDAFIAKTPGPPERHTLARPFLQRLAIGSDSLFKLRRPALASPKSGKRITQIVLGPGPFERHTLAGLFLQYLAIGGDSLFEFRRPTLPAPKVKKRVAQIVLRRGPLARLALAGPFLQRLTKGGGGLFELRRPALALSEAQKCNAQVSGERKPAKVLALRRRKGA